MELHSRSASSSSAGNNTHKRGVLRSLSCPRSTQPTLRCECCRGQRSHQHGLAPYLETPPLLALLHHGPLLRSSNSFACSSSGNASIAARSRTTVLSSASTAPSVHAPTAAAASNRNIADNATQTPPSCTLRSPPPARTVKAMGAMMGMVPSCRGRIGTSITPASTSDANVVVRCQCCEEGDETKHPKRRDEIGDLHRGAGDARRDPDDKHKEDDEVEKHFGVPLVVPLPILLRLCSPATRQCIR
mmetsp:Transcript_9884/g.20097  ORF Transcript_9884/g.20097 Transcript_9884/m.20097 type:complete len:245 (+) Transcript_9884:754-1488(+)